MIVIVAFYLLLYPPVPIVPEIGRNLPSGFEFSERVKKAFPPNTNESVLIKELEEQGFIRGKNRKEAIFSKVNFTCELRWRIRWESSQGLVTKIDGFYGGICL